MDSVQCRFGHLFITRREISWWHVYARVYLGVTLILRHAEQHLQFAVAQLLILAAPKIKIIK
jgi:hypothetical protein